MIKLLELFGGIGACSKALERLNIEHEVVDYVEIDKYAVKSYNAIHNSNFEPQDITQWDKDIEVDLIMHGSPCQDFSLAGKQAGGDEGAGTRSSLMYETIRIVSKLKPKYVIWENVKNLLSVKHRHNFDAYLEIMENLGYENHYQVLNAKDYGIPQNRERVFTISILKECEQNFTFPLKQELTLRLKDMSENEVDEKYYLSEYKINSISHWKAYQKPFEKVQGKNSIVPTLTARGAGEEHSGMITYSDSLDNTTNLQDKCLNIKEATKKGYKEAYDGDSVNLAYPESKTRRGRVGNQVAQTLQCNDSMGVVESKTMKNILCNELVKSGILKIGTIINHSYTNGLNGKNPNSRQKLEDYIESENGILPTMTTRPDCLGVVVKGNYSPSNHNASRIIDENGLAPTVMENHGTITAVEKDLRIRKLTPKECWRLMGFDDEDFEKASQVNSNAQLYKQAGNSIVVQVLEAIFRELLGGL